MAPFLIVTGFGDKGISEFSDVLRRRFPERTTKIIAGCPWHKSFIHPDELVTAVQTAIRENSLSCGQSATDEIDLIGHSYGALLTLTAACRTRMKGINHLILIDGPLNANVDVSPPKKSTTRRIVFELFRRQYRHRVRLALECESVLAELDTTKIVTIGSSRDTVVPPAAKQIPGIRHITLPPEHRGHGLRSKIPTLMELINQHIAV